MYEGSCKCLLLKNIMTNIGEESEINESSLCLFTKSNSNNQCLAQSRAFWHGYFGVVITSTLHLIAISKCKPLLNFQIMYSVDMFEFLPIVDPLPASDSLPHPCSSIDELRLKHFMYSWAKKLLEVSIGYFLGFVRNISYEKSIH